VYLAHKTVNYKAAATGTDFKASMYENSMLGYRFAA